MRVIAGTARGLRLIAPPSRAVRPTVDRVRESMFNALGSLGLVEDARVVDVFAGSGALGIEALSRGAEHATLIDRDRDSIEAIRSNLVTTKLEDRATVVQGDAFATLTSLQDIDIALLDPPWDFERWDELLDAVQARFVVIESNREVDLGARWQSVRTKRYGSTVVTMAQHREDDR